QICAQLALAQARHYSPSLVDHLNQLVLAGHQQLYGASTGLLQAPWRFLAVEFPALVRAEKNAVWLAALLFFGPLLTLVVAIQYFPHLAALLLSPMQMAQMEAMYQPEAHQLGVREASTNTAMFGYYIWNNIRIGFQTFAGGILAGLGSVFFLLFNGLYIGAILGHLTQVGLGPQIHSFIAGHSALELLAIVISGAAGLKLGQGLLFPGRRSRRLALLENARIALRLMLGAALMFFAAAAVEGYFSPMNLPNPLPKYLVGALFWVLLLGYFLRAGRPRGA
ncbi:MAG: stage II sporulation protein M, partial [Xanthomonadales bacterium]|nr:stage II sporulation protein M [Xanthomonadales bacterium]